MDKEGILSIITITGVILVFIAIGMVFIEVYDAHSFCKDESGIYKLNITKYGINHLCDNLTISRYNKDNEVVWDFDKNRNFTISLTNSIE